MDVKYLEEQNIIVKTHPMALLIINSSVISFCEKIST